MVKHLSRFAAAMISTLAFVGTSATVATPTASASPFCHGAQVTGTQTCWGAPRSMTGDQGWGAQRAICIGASIIWGGCAPTGVLKVMNLGTTISGEPWISGNGGGLTTVYGSTF